MGGNMRDLGNFPALTEKNFDPVSYSLQIFPNFSLFNFEKILILCNMIIFEEIIEFRTFCFELGLFVNSKYDKNSQLSNCRSTSVKPAVKPYLQKIHPKTQNKTQTFIFTPTNIHVHFHLLYLYTDPYYKLITLVN